MSDRLPHDWVDMFGGPLFIGDPNQQYKITLQQIEYLFTLRDLLEKCRQKTRQWRETDRIKPSRRCPRQVCSVLNKLEEDRLISKEEEARREFASFLGKFVISQEDES